MKKYIIALVLCLFIVLCIAPVCLAQNSLANPNAQAQPVQLGVPLGSVTELSPDNPIGQYIAIWYTFITGVVGIFATVMIMWGGFKWLTSRGNSSVIGEAKEIIFSAIIGLFLALASYSILLIINPNLINLSALDFSGLEIEEVEDINLQTPGIGGPKAWNDSSYFRSETYEGKNANSQFDVLYDSDLITQDAMRSLKATRSAARDDVNDPFAAAGFKVIPTSDPNKVRVRWDNIGKPISSQTNFDPRIGVLTKYARNYNLTATEIPGTGGKTVYIELTRK